MRGIAFLILVALVVPATALGRRPSEPPPEPRPAPQIAKTYAFDWMDPFRSKCRKVSGKLLSRIKKTFTCEGADPDVGTASGKQLVARCTNTSGKRKIEYLHFATLADCKLERDTQLSHAH